MKAASVGGIFLMHLLSLLKAEIPLSGCLPKHGKYWWLEILISSVSFDIEFCVEFCGSSVDNVAVSSNHCFCLSAALFKKI